MLVRRIDGKRRLRAVIDPDFEPSSFASSANVAMRTSLKVRMFAGGLCCLLECVHVPSRVLELTCCLAPLCLRLVSFPAPCSLRA